LAERLEGSIARALSYRSDRPTGAGRKLWCIADEPFLAIVNPAAGLAPLGQTCRAALARLREKGLHVDVIASTGPGHAVQLAREAYEQGYRRFLAVAATAPLTNSEWCFCRESQNAARITLGFLPLGTGNSFLRDSRMTERKPLSTRCATHDVVDQDADEDESESVQVAEDVRYGECGDRPELIAH